MDSTCWRSATLVSVVTRTEQVLSTASRLRSSCACRTLPPLCAAGASATECVSSRFPGSSPSAQWKGCPFGT